MKHFKDENGKVYAYELDGSQDHLIGNKTPIDDQEAKVLAAAANKSSYDGWFNTLNYAQKRNFSYPPIGDYLDAVVKGDQNALDEYIATCLRVKEQYPKE